jgi:hypothetical protein
LVDLTGFVDRDSIDRKRFSDELQIETLIARAREHLQPGTIFRQCGAFVGALGRVRALRQSSRGTPSESSGSRALDFFWLKVRRDFERALELSTGVYFEVLADDPEVTPGQSFNILTNVVNRSSETIEIQQILLESQWKNQLLEGEVQPLPPHEKVALKVSGPLASVLLPPNETLSLKFSITVPEDAKPSSPQWKRTSKQDAVYTFSDPTRINEPLIPTPLSASMEYRLCGTSLRLKHAAEYLDKILRGTREFRCWLFLRWP